MKRRITIQDAVLALALAALFMFSGATLAHAQNATQDQLRATIYAQITADPRSKTMTQAQIYALVNALADQAQKQNVTTDQLTSKPGEAPTPASTLTPCSDVTCSVTRAFGLDGSFPIIPLALFILATLFILLYSLMRELGHPHAQA